MLCHQENGQNLSCFIDIILLQVTKGFLKKNKCM